MGHKRPDSLVVFDISVLKNRQFHSPTFGALSSLLSGLGGGDFRRGG